LIVILDSRAATNALLETLAARRWTLSAWLDMLAKATARSAVQAWNRPFAVAEIVVAEGAVAYVSRRRMWPMLTALLALTHMGLLGGRRTLGPANLVSLGRANLPALVNRQARWLPGLALISDVIDGALARHGHRESSFGIYADTFADLAFWCWYTGGDEDPRVRGAGMAAWVLPATLVAGVSIARGRMVDVPRPAFLRPAAILQLVLATRAVLDTGESA
jgi:hypothetical protein